MSLSVIIPTFNRIDALQKCLDSILIQSELPEEIVIVDDSSVNDVKNLIESMRKEIYRHGIALKYAKGEAQNTLPGARNIGVDIASGDVIMFFDDDTVLDRNYIKEIMKLYSNPGVMGVQGHIINTPKPKATDLIRRFFFLNYSSKNNCRYFPSLCATYPYKLDKVIPCEWMSGCNHSYRREVFETIRYDNKLKKYAPGGEDSEMAYRVLKKYPNSLFMTPNAKISHNVSEEGRLEGRTVYFMREVYTYYLFHKNWPQTLKNKFIYRWSKFGYFLMKTAYGIIHLQPGSIKNLIGAYWYTFQHGKQIRSGNIDFFNEALFAKVNPDEVL